MKGDDFSARCGSGPCCRHQKNLTLKKKEAAQERPRFELRLPSCRNFSRAHVVFITVAAFQSPSKKSISVVKHLRIEMENDSELNQKRSKLEQPYHPPDDFISRRKILEYARQWGSEASVRRNLPGRHGFAACRILSFQRTLS